MKYILLIYDDPKVWEAMTESEIGKLMAEYRQFTDELHASGHFIAGSQLQPETSATSVRKREGKVLLTDGPFMETRETLGGYYLVNAKDLDEAVSLAERIPSARYGTIEVRPLVERAAEAQA